VWGMPHVFAIFLIVAASGVLNVASIASVFDQRYYKPLAPLSGWLAIALLSGGLAVLSLDLGRPERLIVAMTHYNFKSIFAWNMFLYSGFVGLVALYLWSLLDPMGARFAPPAGAAAFAWRLVLTTGTGSIFGFLIAREAYASAVLAPMFVALSFSYGLAVYLLVLVWTCAGSGRALGEPVLARLARLLGWFIVAALYFVAVFHLANLYVANRIEVERFLLLESGIYTALFWIGQVGLGSLVPLCLVWHSRLRHSRAAVVAAALLVVAGGFAQMYVTIIGAQAFPLDLFPGYEVRSSFHDGVINSYVPSLPEAVLGISGVAIAAWVTLLGVKFLKLVPESVAEEALAAQAAAGPQIDVSAQKR
ncbi:MAG: polysulfide reductase NrfD, partial [Betaproteobacteria bacterium]|nr:polysulfide reductase NrfD [Betaproteobacteria bacterium]